MRSGATATRLQARIRQLCCQGFGGHVIVTGLLHDLHVLIPSCGNTFFWVDERLDLSGIYGENPASAPVEPLYLEQFHSRCEVVVSRGFSEAAHIELGGARVQDTRSVDPGMFYRSDLSDLILRPMDYHPILRMAVHDGRRLRGVLQLQRGPEDPPFSTDDMRLLKQLHPFIAHALSQRATCEDVPLAPSGEHGLIVVSAGGRPLYCSPQGRRLMFLATHASLHGCAPGTAPLHLPFQVARICRRLAKVFDADPNADVPVVRLRNVWGGFTFRAYWLDSTDEQYGAIGVSVEREEPLMVRLMRGTLELALSERQEEVAVLLACGESHQQIAERLGISRHTVISHSRWIYSKLGVHSAQGLRERLMAGSGYAVGAA